MSRGSDTTSQALWNDPALAELVEQETAAVLWSLDGNRVIGASVGTAGLAPALRAAGGENLRGRLRRVAAALSAGSGVRLERVTLPQGYGVARLLLECHRVATGEGEFLLTILRGPLPRLPRVVAEGSGGGEDAPRRDAEVLAAAQHGDRASPAAVQRGALDRLLAYAGERASVRFIWESDAEGRFTRVSQELAALVGEAAGLLEGRAWQALADAGVVADPGGSVAAALAQQATWSGREVLWRIGDDAAAPRLPVELAGIPMHDGQRRFRGYRGFGIARVSRLRDGAGAGAGAVAPAAGPAAPRRHEPLREDGPPHRDEPHLTATSPEVSAEAPRAGLSDNEKQAFRDIARALGGARLSEDAPAAGEPPPAGTRSAGDEAVARRGHRRLRLVGDGADEAASPQLRADPEAEERPAVPPAWAVTGEETLDGLPGEAVASGAAPLWHDDAGAPDAPSGPAATAEVSDADAFAPHVAGAMDASEPDFEPHPVEPASGGVDATDAVALIANRLPIGMLVSRDGEVLFVNRALLSLLGYDDASAFRRAGGLRALFMSAPGGGDAPLSLRTAHGTPLAVDARMATVPWRGRPATLMSFRRAMEPRTEAHLRALERELRHQEARVRALDTILDTATDGVVTLDGLGRLLSMNRSAEALFGCEETDVVGGAFWHLLSPRSRSVAAAYFDGLRAGGLASALNDGLAVAARADRGGEIPLMMIMGRLAPDPGDDTPGYGALRHGGGAQAGRSQRFFAILRDVSGVQPGSAGAVPAPVNRASGDQAQFLARVSHEIRTPLNSIIGFAEIMLEERFGPVGTERYREYLRDIHASGGQVISLVNDLLDLARIEAGRLELAPVNVSLNDVVSGCVGLMMPQAERRQVVLRTSLPPGLAPVNVDERALQQVVLNLLSNAVKFTDAGGQVIVSTARADDGGATLRIRDTGIGMTRAQVTAALAPFSQLGTTHLGRLAGSGSGGSGLGGSGLGLPLTRALVEASGGRFAVTSAPMEGTLVEIAFPRALSPAPAQDKARPSPSSQ